MPITSQTKIDAFYQALLERNTAYVGVFFVGVKTTSVFCIATCRARKPKKVNTEFFATFEEALQHGYRPCKVCKPTENAEEVPERIAQAIQLVKDFPKEKISDERLRTEGIAPETVRRWFKKHYNLTFHAFQRMYRINNAYKELKDGKKTTQTAFEQGYESLSGFGYTYKKLVGQSPNNSKKSTILLLHRLTTPLGPMLICASEQGVCLLEFTDRKMLETELGDLQKRLSANILIGENAHIRQAKREISEYFAGNRKVFTTPLHTPGTAFQNKAWQTLQSVAYGETISYGALATQMTPKSSARAVAHANAHNRLAIIIPCHRVIGKDGTLRGYGGGLERKRWLIEFEKRKK
ncbi:MAG: bifunctional transcriptional activator/DNA repair enzyme AdaA [Saprospiraceae bacterium]